ncbi:MAG TPA: hypothetical protein VGQ71_04405, partial [Terriglobales bacterium]|nr:hypothetical protein [Terriglobales bacterium]
MDTARLQTNAGDRQAGLTELQRAQRSSPRPKGRYCSPELKAQVMQECGQFGAAIAGGALRHDINANMVHRWW